MSVAKIKTKTIWLRDSCFLQVGALVYRYQSANLEILLITSRGTGRWIIPKGWVMPDRSLAQAALREAYEEAGVRGVVEVKAIGSYEYRKYDLPEEKNLFIVDVFPVLFSHQEKKWPEKKQRQYEWVSIEEACERVDENGLKVILQNFMPFKNAVDVS